MFSLACSILIFYMTYKRYIVSGHFDKDTADFYRRNGMLSRDDLLMGLFLISGISDFISAFTETNFIEKGLRINSWMSYVCKCGNYIYGEKL